MNECPSTHRITIKIVYLDNSVIGKYCFIAE